MNRMMAGFPGFERKVIVISFKGDGLPTLFTCYVPLGEKDFNSVET